MVNVSNIYAMGGRAIAIVDTLWSQSIETSQPIWEGLKAASQVYQVPIVGGYINCHSNYNALSVAILGKANHLITSFNAQPGDLLLTAIDLRGKYHPQYPFWNAATQTNHQQLRDDLSLLLSLAESGLCDAGKDISMEGIIRTLLMFMETSQYGAILNLDTIPRSPEIPLETWLISFPSYGFLLSIRPENVAVVQSQFENNQITCAVVGTVQAHRQVILQSQGESVVFWDFQQEKLTGWR